MRSMFEGRLSAALLLGLMPIGAVQAQEAVTTETPAAPAAASPVVLLDSISPFGTVKVTDEDIAKVEMPELAFQATPEDEKNFDKYYFFNRPGTDFATAYADISECDGYARGLASGITYQQAPYPYAGTMAGAIGGAIGNAMAVAIFGSAEKRRLRRVNMRKCMNFKGYERYGLAKDKWEPFNFEEGLSGVSETDRRRYLKQQALVAASYKPVTKGLGL
jgi:hypothetical protein